MDKAVKTKEERPDYSEALRIALRQGLLGDIHRVEDAWGGYWQCNTVHGPYNFRT
jgi:hypothetical protein